MLNGTYPNQLLPAESQMPPDYLLFAQHGWADTATAIRSLALELGSDSTPVIAPDLGWLATWIRIDPLIQTVETTAESWFVNYPDTPWRIIGHSMGGLIWIELLHRHPEWQERVHSLVLIASPVRGAGLARMLDPLRWGLGIAGDLGKNRLALAEQIAATIPTLVIAGDIDNGSDGIVTVQATQFDPTHQVILPHSHPQLKRHPDLIPVIQSFWQAPTVPPQGQPDPCRAIIQAIAALPGITPAHPRDLTQARLYLRLPNGVCLWKLRNLWQVDHIFVTDPQGRCQFSGFVGWQEREAFWAGLKRVEQTGLQPLSPSGGGAGSDRVEP
ncbi:MAG: alpha/beta hydrolase [Synechococcaceae cyanobacterium SM2_3_1]|nr:alpha/beta hydrolase [Synechococcaceae cyanobacterium SM2_3_1]